MQESQPVKKDPFPQERRILQSNELFSGASEVVIQHNRDYYRLLITKAGKLILNK